jgi:hypothetical protein
MKQLNLRRALWNSLDRKKPSRPEGISEEWVKSEGAKSTGSLDGCKGVGEVLAQSRLRLQNHSRAVLGGTPRIARLV